MTSDLVYNVAYCTVHFSTDWNNVKENLEDIGKSMNGTGPKNKGFWTSAFDKR